MKLEHKSRHVLSDDVYRIFIKEKLEELTLVMHALYHISSKSRFSLESQSTNLIEINFLKWKNQA